MATYLGNGQYNLLDVMRKSKDPSINYDGLYEDPSRDQGSYTSNPFKAMTSSDYQYLNPKSLKSRNNSDQYNIFSPYDVPVNQRMRLDNIDYNRDQPFGNSYGGPQGSQFDNFNPRIGRPEVVSDFVAGDDGLYLGGNYPDNPYPDNTELGDMTGLVTDQFYDQIDKAPTITDMIENNQYDVNDTALGIMENAFNQRQIMADETSAGNYPIEQISPTIDYSNVMGKDLEANEGAQIVNGLKQPYTMRGQLAKDFSKDGIPKDFIDGLRLAGSELNEDFGNIKGKIGTGFDNLKTGIFNNPLTRGAGTAFNFLRGSVPGMLMSGLGAIFNRDPKAPSYEKYTPGFDYNNLNESMINDFYDSNPESDDFGTNRFDRAVPGSFGSFRTLAGYLNRNKNAAEALTTKKAKKEAAIQQQIQDKINAAEAAARGNYTPGGSHLSRGTSGGGLGLSQAQAQSVSQANKDAGYSSFSGLKDGGLASMFTRRR